MWDMVQQHTRVSGCPLTHRFQNLQLVLDSLAASTDVLAMLAALLLVLLVVSATVLYFTENALVESSWFDSIPVTMYYMHVRRVYHVLVGLGLHSEARGRWRARRTRHHVCNARA